MVFGVFDGLHAGHKYFLTEAEKHGELIVVVARDVEVKLLKNKTPQHDEQTRMATIREFMPEATVALGDEEQGIYAVITVHQPDMICLGHDQQALAADLQRAMDDGTIPAIAFIHVQKKGV